MYLLCSFFKHKVLRVTSEYLFDQKLQRRTIVRFHLKPTMDS